MQVVVTRIYLFVQIHLQHLVVQSALTNLLFLSSLTIIGTLEFSYFLIQEIQVTELRNPRHSRHCKCRFVLLLKRLSFRVSGLRVHHPVDRKGIAKARSNVYTVNSCPFTTETGIRWLFSVCSGHCVDIFRFSQIREHRARITGFDVESEFLEQLFFLHLLEDGVKLVRINIWAAPIWNTE